MKEKFIQKKRKNLHSGKGSENIIGLTLSFEGDEQNNNTKIIYPT